MARCVPTVGAGRRGRARPGVQPLFPPKDADAEARRRWLASSPWPEVVFAAAAVTRTWVKTFAHAVVFTHVPGGTHTVACLSVPA